MLVTVGFEKARETALIIFVDEYKCVLYGLLGTTRVMAFSFFAVSN